MICLVQSKAGIDTQMQIVLCTNATQWGCTSRKVSEPVSDVRNTCQSERERDGEMQLSSTSRFVFQDFQGSQGLDLRAGNKYVLPLLVVSEI